jgi:hypothetical protein
VLNFAKLGWTKNLAIHRKEFFTDYDNLPKFENFLNHKQESFSNLKLENFSHGTLLLNILQTFTFKVNFIMLILKNLGLPS